MTEKIFIPLHPTHFNPQETKQKKEYSAVPHPTATESNRDICRNKK